MATTPSHNFTVETWPAEDNGANPAVPATNSVVIPDSEKYTKFLFILAGCTNSSTWQIHASLVGNAEIVTAPVPLISTQDLTEGQQNMQSLHLGALTKTAATDLAFQVELSAPALGGLTLVCNSNNNTAAGAVSVSMWGSVYSQGLK